MTRLRPGDWACGLGAVALVVLLFLDRGRSWGDQGIAAVVVVVIAVAAALAMVGLTATQPSPAWPLVACVTAFVWGVAAVIAFLVQAHWPELAAATVLLGGAALAMRDERMPGAGVPEITRRPAPPVA